MPQVRHATPDDCAAIGEALADAFQDDPIWRWLIPDDDRWNRRAARFYTAEVSNRVRLGHTYTDVGGLGHGAAEWCPPGRFKPSLADLVREALPSIGLFAGALPKALRFLLRVEKVHPPKPDHWYLAMLGTHPDHQGKGLGSALLRPVLDICDSDGTPAYLESSKESNVPFYQRHGFELMEPILTPGGPTTYPMWRDPVFPEKQPAEKHNL